MPKKQEEKRVGAVGESAEYSDVAEILQLLGELHAKAKVRAAEIIRERQASEAAVAIGGIVSS
jgi:hypothetical protein